MHIKYCHLVSLSHKDWTHLENTNSDATPATKNNNFILINCLLIISLMVCDYQFTLGFVFLASKLGLPTHNVPHATKQRDSGKREKEKGMNSLSKSPPHTVQCTLFQEHMESYYIKIPQTGDNCC